MYIPNHHAFLVHNNMLTESVHLGGEKLLIYRAVCAYNVGIVVEQCPVRVLGPPGLTRRLTLLQTIDY